MLRAALVALALMALSARAEVPLPQAVAAKAPWQLVGSGQMQWFVFTVYDAALWQAPGAQALAIRYARSIASATLAETTIEELTRLGLPAAERWRADLQEHFPDVVEGEVIVAVRQPGLGVRFYHQGRATGAIRDSAFADAFFGIWLDPRTRAPELRAALLGEAGR
ncbi:chalcone isomerase family protein [Denitromonas iodatirespirans]|uniref:Chalcone isomerase family protein n=1 Tax=Denitromonas iodatirespirans TaxID=2795389 RepID=A0A944D960_DENI1|nr:chalcone isomerase family protein [Denitromonas iodatirespirans]MBT0962460.1 chalcone isomerase family protein [Denitromonas iodatirespirans]